MREFDSAHMLLQNKNGYVYQLWQAMDMVEQEQLGKLAQEKFEDKPYQAPPQSLGGMMAPSAALITAHNARNFLPSFQTNRISGVLSHFTGNRFSTNRF